MKQVRNMWKAINSLIWNEKNVPYSLKVSEWKALVEVGSAIDAVSYAFDYGFIKGIRYQKAQQKKKRNAVSE